MAKKFDTNPVTPGDDDELNGLSTELLQQRIAALELRIRSIEKSISSTLSDPAFRTRLDPDDASWVKNEKSLGRIAGIISNPIGKLRKRLDDETT
jgi:hypothetical protein